MKKIIIVPHNCSREEYKELIDFLEENCWDYKQEESEDEDEGVKYILRSDGIQCNLSSNKFIELSDRICEEDLHEYSIVNREDLIEDLYRWVGEGNKDKEMMKEDIRMLEKWTDEYIFSSNSTNSYISSECSEFEKTCEELIELNESL